MPANVMQILREYHRRVAELEERLFVELGRPGDDELCLSWPIARRDHRTTSRAIAGARCWRSRAGRKVMNLECDDRGETALAGFRGGAWQARLLLKEIYTGAKA